jgi:hypothetical protein
MTYVHPGARAPDLVSCRYGVSRLMFRGPCAPLDAPYVAALGGTETYGSHVADPWPALLAFRIGRRVVNLGAAHAGPDLWLREPALIDVAAKAALRVVQVTGAINLSNPFYTVHPRRNDRFLTATAALRDLYPEVDFTEYHFTRHLAFDLRRRDPHRFAEVTAVLAATWQDRMRALLDAIGGPTILLLVGDPPGTQPRLESRPPLVTAALLDGLRGATAGLITVPCPAEPEDGMPMSAFGLPGPATHARVAAALAAAVPA